MPFAPLHLDSLLIHSVTLGQLVSPTEPQFPQVLKEGIVEQEDRVSALTMETPNTAVHRGHPSLPVAVLLNYRDVQ